MFEMGSPNSNSDDERPVRTVQISTFEMGRYEVTVSDFRAFVTSSEYVTDAERHADQGCAFWSVEEDKWQWKAGANWKKVGFLQAEDHPVLCISWNDAQQYVQWMNANTEGGYRLPSEAQWEYAARAGGQGQYHFGNSESQLCDYANGADKSTEKEFAWSNQSCLDGYERTAPVGSFKANGNGLYDMHGNVWELTQDCWHENYKGAPADGSVWAEGGDCTRRVLRGGSWNDKPVNLRIADRVRVNTSFRNFDTGFRLQRRIR